MPSTISLNYHLKELLQHPDFEYEVETEHLADNTTVFTFDTERSNFDLILDGNRETALLMEYEFVPSPDGSIDDFDVKFKSAYQILEATHFLEIIK
ncbi:MAG: hypothetical protein QNJ68_07935 [Microcoleaceae cyanobacterium MO_207.B10]|nr:hypothetical protein [Microcoleaceae cyanobacterium MO_207.B10]